MGSVLNLETFPSLGYCLSCDLDTDEVWLETSAKFWFLLVMGWYCYCWEAGCFSQVLSLNLSKTIYKVSWIISSLITPSESWLSHAHRWISSCVSAKILPRMLFLPSSWDCCKSCGCGKVKLSMQRFRTDLNYVFCETDGGGKQRVMQEGDVLEHHHLCGQPY